MANVTTAFIRSRAGRSIIAALALPVAAAWIGSWLINGEAVGESVARSAQAQAPAPLAPAVQPSAGPATWVVDPTVPGDNLPPAGRSLFDFLVMDKRIGKAGYAVPFPFAALVSRVKEQNHDEETPAVLIPLGRSLQRSAAAPDFFTYPRVVVAVDKDGAGNAGMVLRDRLYLGYQEKANIIEVISYNEAAARFEFQIVKDYRPGGSPRVLYANRAVCMACHQNGGPIFPRQVWDETNANPGIAARLRGERRDFYGIRLDRGVDVPYAIDNATDRANLLPVYQKLWREGCDAREEQVREGQGKAVRCRASLLTAALQYRLSGDRQFDIQAGYAAHVVPVLAANWAARWPNGLALPNPDIPNRDPLAGPRGGSADVAAAFDPLLPREPLEIWQPADKADAKASDMARLVVGLSQFIAAADVRRLDGQLFGQAVKRNAPRRSYRADCEIRRKEVSQRRARVEFSCVAANESPQQRLVAEGQFDVLSGKIAGGSVERLAIGGTGELHDLPISGGEEVSIRGTWHARIRLGQAGMHVRGGDGNTIEELDLTWSVRIQRRTASPLQAYGGKMSATVLEDFLPAKKAVADMVSASLDGKLDVFSAMPFRRAAVMPALFSRLGMASETWCCLDGTGMHAAEVEPVNVTTADSAHTAMPSTAPLSTPMNGRLWDGRPSAMRPFYQYCATCHQTAEPLPPNFLAGTPGQVSAKLAHCAERLYVRLSMWQLPAGDRPKTPMPPVHALAGFGRTPEAWRVGGELSALKTYVSETLQSQTGKPPRVEELVGRGYENLRTCLPAAG